MTTEISGNLLPLIDYASSRGLAAEINTIPRNWDRTTRAEPYATFYRAMVVSPVDSRLYDATVNDFASVEPELRYNILAEAINGLDDEVVAQHSDKILQLVGSSEQAASQSAEDVSTSVRSQLDRVTVLDRLQRVGLLNDFTFDQDHFLEQIIDPENDFEIVFDELLSLEPSYDPNKKTKEELIAAFNQWADDPQGGKKVLRSEGMAFKQKDLAMGYETGRRKGQETPEAEALTKVGNYLRTNSHDLIAAYVEDLLFERSPIGLKLVDSLSAQGFRGLLFESSEQMTRAYGLALAAQGRLEEAEAVASGPRLQYEDYAYIHLEIARSQRKGGSPEQAISKLDSLREIDPVLNFADSVDVESHSLMMGGSPLGFMNEIIAEEYALCGAFAKALQAYKQSRQYPEQTEPHLAQTAIEHNAADKYFDELLAFEADEHDTMFMISRLSIALLKGLNDKLSLGEAFADKYPAVVAKVPALTGRLLELRSQRTNDSLATRVIDESLITIFTAMGSYDAALEMLGGRQEAASTLRMQAFGAILTDMARRGQYEKAIAIYDDLAEHYSRVSDFDVPKFNIAVMGWSLVHGQLETFDRFYNLLPDYKRSLALFSMLQTFEDQNLQIDNDLAEQIMRSEFLSDKLAGTAASLGRLMLGKNAVVASHAHILK